ncbi:M14 family zinc carboxypeptidase [Psychroserpens ponticola]|uniref:M14 family zinc carboxypeptidase n=1 Tax=Psychroserpens ponticola TaxID=2932268 RepID=A0ABY7RUZ4_9FLAO|nr:M14 family zinc carboxypeptidase [Psychroserpens ponticola]WCO00587.1 M14 family zinc carboxypeptidase [Psychroserpens ponticola]
MRKITFLYVLLLLMFFSVHSQTTNLQKAQKYIELKGEVCLVFTAHTEAQVEEISQFLSVGHKVNRETLEIEAYANAESFQQFLSYGLTYTVNQNDNEFSTSDNYDVLAWDTSWDEFPTYNQYVAKMNYFATTYPTLCTLQSIGSTPQGRELLVLKISDNAAVDEAEPEFMYTSSMHGDELTGYPLMIRLIDYLLSNYGSDTEVNNLINSTEIYINPLANPDGTYRNYSNNQPITNPIRANSAGQDLNRNYPDNAAGLHDNGATYQPETKAFMAFEASRDFVLSANFHGGTEVINYPYDNTTSKHVDHDFYEHISNEYAINCQNDSPNNYYNGISGRNAGGNNHPNYMTVEYDSPENPSSPGVTQGSIWYQVYGGRQDYMNFYRHTKEITIELSFVKFVNGSALPDLWTFNKQAFLDYIKQANYGFQGIVSDESGNPVVAEISIAGHDALNSYVFSNEDHGDYYRLIKGGNYNVTYKSPGYVTQTINVNVTDNTKTIQNVTMVASTPLVNANNATINTNESASLSATGSGTINWYQNIDDETPIATGNSYNTPNLTTTTSYFVEDLITKGNVGSTNHSANGSLFEGGSTDRYLIFDSTESVLLKEVTINAGQAGEMEVQLQDESGNMLDSRIIIVESAGLQQIELNFMIPAENNLRLTSTEMSSGFTLFRNNSGTGNNYPYTNGSITIKGNNINDLDYYYFFYDWNLEDLKSARKEVVVTVEDTLGIKENALENVSVYPNPFSNSITIKLPYQSTNSNINIQLYDISGRTILNLTNINFRNGHFRLENTQNISKGSYFLKISDNETNNSIIKQLIKQ